MSSDGIEEAARLYEEKRYEDALSQYVLLAEQGDELAARWAGWIIDKGLCAQKDPQEAIRYYLLAAESGSKEGMFEVAGMYARVGEYQRAFEWYERSAAEGHMPALYRLGQCYLFGRGVAQDERKGVECFEEAANQGHVFAKSRLARRRLVCDYGSVGGWVLYRLWCFKAYVEIARIVMSEEDPGTDERLMR